MWFKVIRKPYVCSLYYVIAPIGYLKFNFSSKAWKRKKETNFFLSEFGIIMETKSSWKNTTQLSTDELACLGAASILPVAIYDKMKLEKKQNDYI